MAEMYVGLKMFDLNDLTGHFKNRFYIVKKTNDKKSQFHSFVFLCLDQIQQSSLRVTAPKSLPIVILSCILLKRNSFLKHSLEKMVVEIGTNSL